MKNGFDKLSIKSAVKSHSKMDLSRTHLTTMDFGQITPLFVEETVPGDKFNVSAQYFSRMAPLVKPTYGKVYFKTMSAFVPYYQICDGIDAWMTGMSAWEGDTSSSRFFTLDALVNSLFSSDAITAGVCTDVTSDVGSGAWYDFTMIDGSNNRKYYRLSALGKFYVKILNSLGYSLPDGVSYVVSSNWYKNLRSKKLSALPFLAFAKAYNDWMSQSQRYNNSVLTKVLKYIKHDKNVDYSTGQGAYTSSGHLLTAGGIRYILSQIKLCYENDYFTSAWQNPNSATNSLNITTPPAIPGQAVINPMTLRGDVNDNTISTTLYNELSIDPEDLDAGITGDIVFSVGQRALDFLKSFDDWVRRNNYSGSRAVQQVYSRFGIKTEDYKSNYAHVINTSSVPVQVGDITATGPDYVGSGSANNVELGDYAGKGITSGNDGFQFEAKDYGLLVILGWYTVDPMNCYGFDKSVLRTEPFDYYNPEFDGLGAEPISIQEVFTNPRLTGVSMVQSDSVFGFTERYNSYRYGKDKITGDFRKMNLVSGSYQNTGTEMNVWHTGRLLSSLRDSNLIIAQSDAFNTLAQTDSEYNRIFSITDGSVDHFYMTAQFNVSAVRPMLSLNQVPNLGEGDTVVSKNGNEIN